MKDREKEHTNENPGKKEKLRNSLKKTIFFLGPGTYAAEKVKVIATVKDMMSNSFTTKVSLRLIGRH